MNNTLNVVIRKVARELGIDYKVAEHIYKSYWYFIKNHISSLPLKDFEQTEFKNTITNINLPYIGKLYTNQDKIEKYKRQLKYYRDVKAKKSKTNRVPGSSN